MAGNKKRSNVKTEEMADRRIKQFGALTNIYCHDICKHVVVVKASVVFK